MVRKSQTGLVRSFISSDQNPNMFILISFLKDLRKANIIYVVEVGTKNNIKCHNYLMPYQEEFYAQILGSSIRDFSHYNPIKYVKKTVRKKKSVSDDIDPLFFTACHKLISLKIDTPNKILDIYSDDLDTLRTVMFMCDCAYIIKKHCLMPEQDPIAILVDFIKDGNIDRNAFGVDITEKVKRILIKDKQKIKK